MSKLHVKLPDDFSEIMKQGTLEEQKSVFDACDSNAHGGYSKQGPLFFTPLSDDFARWLVGRGADLDLRDRFGHTALHEQCAYWNGNPRILIELGADLEARANDGDTPFHEASTHFRVDVMRLLIASGAKIDVRNNRGRTPLEAALARAENKDIPYLAEVVDTLLASGSPRPANAAMEMERIGKGYEFYKDRFPADFAAQAAPAIARLYATLGVEPVPSLQRHDGVSPIRPRSVGWQKQHAELWDLLVPGSGACATVQGETIRITGRISSELYDNGGANWDAEYAAMLRALRRYLAMGQPLDQADMQKEKELAGRVAGGQDYDASAGLAELAVAWVLRNPTPITLGEVSYRR